MGLPTLVWETAGDLEVEPREGGVWGRASAGQNAMQFTPQVSHFLQGNGYLQAVDHLYSLGDLEAGKPTVTSQQPS